jgi:hypothetical protein
MEKPGGKRRVFVFARVKPGRATNALVFMAKLAIPKIAR